MTELCRSLEAVLFASGDPVSIGRLSLVLACDEESVRNAAEELKEILSREGHGLCVLQLEDKFQMCSIPEESGNVTKVLEQRKPSSLSQAALETLAIVAYFQPTTAAYISKVRGVDSSYSISSLVDKNLIEVKRRLEVPGRPMQYGTTDVFLRSMGITELSQLPPLPKMEEGDALEKLKDEIDQLCSGTSDQAPESPLPGQLKINDAI